MSGRNNSQGIKSSCSHTKDHKGIPFVGFRTLDELHSGIPHGFIRDRA